MKTNEWNVTRSYLAGFHFEPDMHMYVIAATREIPYCAHRATACACCNTNGFPTTLREGYMPYAWELSLIVMAGSYPPYNFMTSRPARDRRFFYHSIVLVEEVLGCYPYGVLLNRLPLTSFHAFSGVKDNHSRDRRQSKQDGASRLRMFPARLMSCISASSLPIVPPDDRITAQSLFRAGMIKLKDLTKRTLAIKGIIANNVVIDYRFR
jgi:hypothetical protein